MVLVVRLRVIDTNIRTHPNKKMKIEFHTFVGFIPEFNIYVGPKEKKLMMGGKWKQGWIKPHPEGSSEVSTDL